MVRLVSLANCSNYRRFWNTLSKITENTIPQRFFDNIINNWWLCGEKFIEGYENIGGNCQLMGDFLGLGYDDCNLKTQKKIRSLVPKLVYVSFDLIAFYFPKKNLFQKNWKTYQSERRNF